MKANTIWKKSWFRKLAVFIAVVVVAAGGFGIYAAVKSAKEKNALFDVTPGTGRATKGSLSLSIAASGSLTGSGAVTVKAAGPGEILEVAVSAGDTVKAGDTLATIDTQAVSDQIETLEEQIVTLRQSIDGARNAKDNYFIKANADGTVKCVKVSDGTLIEHTMAEYGYLALLSTQDKMRVNMTEMTGTLTANEAVTVKTQGYAYAATVEDVNGTLMPAIATDARTVGADASVYGADGAQIGTGTLELASYEPVVSVRGEITAVDAVENEDVAKGDLLFTASAYSQALLDSERKIEDCQEQITELTALLGQTSLTAPCAGIVTAVSKSAGDILKEGEPVVTVMNTQTWILDVSVDELDINRIEVGQTARITLDALPDAVYEGQVTDISSSASSSGGITSYSVRLSLAGDASFKLGMNASAEIVVEHAEEAILVPVEAVRTLGDLTYVVVYKERTDEELQAIKQQILESQSGRKTARQAFTGNDGNGGAAPGGNRLAMALTLNGSVADRLYSEAVEVEVGIENETYAQIVSGVSEGDIVLLPESTSTEDSGNNFMIPGGMGFGDFGGRDGGGIDIPGGGQRPGGDSQGGGNSGGNAP